MSKLVDLTVYKNEHAEPCIFCGDAAHSVPLMCPRIEGVDIDPNTGGVLGLHFWAEFDMEDWDGPDDAA